LQPVVVVTLPAGCASVNGGCVSRHRLVIQADIASAAYWAPRSALLMRNATSNRRRQWGWRVFAKGFFASVELSGLRGRRIARCGGDVVGCSNKAEPPAITTYRCNMTTSPTYNL
jgi:hypothetical protein